MACSFDSVSGWVGQLFVDSATREDAQTSQGDFGIGSEGDHVWASLDDDT